LGFPEFGVTENSVSRVAARISGFPASHSFQAQRVRWAPVLYYIFSHIELKNNGVRYGKLILAMNCSVNV
jgi:hypothetical protein